MKRLLYGIIVAVFIGLLVLAHAIVLETFISVFGISNHHFILVLQSLLLVLILGFVAFSIISNFRNNYLTRILYTLTASWIGVFIYVFMASMIYGLAVAVALFFNTESSLIILGQTLFVAAMIVASYGLINARHIKVTHVNAPISDIPNSWKGKTAVWISDIHLGQIYYRKRLVNIVQKINQLNPDIVFIGGDLYDGVAVDELSVIQPFKDMQAGLGTFFVMGNHEEFHDNSKYLHAIKSVGIHVLHNEVVTIHGLQIAGVDYHETVGEKRFSHVLDHLNLNPREPSILLKHVPLGLELASKAGVSFMISGHTHQGQFFPLPFITRILYKGYDYGLKKYKAMNVFTSSGVGGWGPPMRIGTRSEIVHITF